MKRKNFFVVKLAVLTLMLGFFSPSVTLEESSIHAKVASATELVMPQGLLAKLSTSEIKFTLFNQAEARKYRKRRYRKARRRTLRRAHRRANYRHIRRSRNYRGYDRRRNNTGAVIGAAVVGAVVGAAINESR